MNNRYRFIDNFHSNVINYTDDNGLPVTYKIVGEVHKINPTNKYVVLSQKPSINSTIKIRQNISDITNFNDVIEYREVSTIISKDEFIFDRANNYIQFHQQANGNVKVDYQSEGKYIISGDNIVTEYDDKGNPIEYLNELIKKSNNALANINDIGSLSNAMEQIRAYILSSINVSGELYKNVTVGKNVNYEIEKNIPIADLKTTQLVEANENVQDTINKIETTGGQPFLITPTMWGEKQVDNYYKCIITHSYGTRVIGIDGYYEESGFLIGNVKGKILDNNNVEVWSETKENIVYNVFSRAFKGANDNLVAYSTNDLRETSTKKYFTPTHEQTLVNVKENKADKIEFDNYKNGVHKIDYKSVSVTLKDGMVLDNGYLDHLVYQGASISLCIMCNVTNLNDPNIVTISDSTVVKAINDIKAKGIKIDMIKPHIGVDFRDVTNRKDYVPSDYSLFFKNWTDVLLKYAEICNKNNIPVISIGCEQQDNIRPIRKNEWRKLSDTLRNRYPNLKQTYSCNFEEWYLDTDNAIYEIVDFIGCNIYLQWYPYEYTPNLTYRDVAKRLYSTYSPINGQNGCTTVQRLNYLTEKYGKPIYITEVGCMPYPDGLIGLFSKYKDDRNKEDFRVSAIVYEAVFKVLCNMENVVGVSIWHIDRPFHYWGDVDTNPTQYVAEELIKKYFKGGLI